MISEASGSVLSSAASLSTSLKQEEMLSGKACVATSRGSVVGNATTELDSGRPLKKVKDEGGQKHYGEKDERDLEEDDQGDDPEDVHLAGQKPERRPWSRREDDAVTRLVTEHGTSRKWSLIAGNLSREIVGVLRTGKQCNTRWVDYLDPSIKKDPWTQDEEDILYEAQHRMGNQWAEIAKLLVGRTEHGVKLHWCSNTRDNSRRSHKDCVLDTGAGGGGSGGGAATTSPRPGGNDDAGGRHGDPWTDVASEGGGGGGVCASVGRVGGPESSSSFPLPVAMHGTVASTADDDASTARVSLSPLPTSSASVSVDGRSRCQVTGEHGLVNQSSIGSLPQTETVTLQTAYEELNKQLEGKCGDVSGIRTTTGGGGSGGGGGNGNGASFDPAISQRHPPAVSAAEVHSQTTHHPSAVQQVEACAGNESNTSPPLPAPASSVGSQGGSSSDKQITGKRSRPQLFVNTNVDAGMYIGHHGPQESEGASAAAAAIAAAQSAARVASRASSQHASSVHHHHRYGCPPGMATSAAAAASAAAAEAARYGGGMGGGMTGGMGGGMAGGMGPGIGHPSMQAMPPMHHPLRHQQQSVFQQQHQPPFQQTPAYQQPPAFQQQQPQFPVGGVPAGAGGGGGGRGCTVDYPIAIPGTSVRRYMHVQLLLALMSAPGLQVAAPAKVSWSRLGYYPVDAVFGPPAPGGPTTALPGLTPTESMSVSPMPDVSTRCADQTTIDSPPSKRAHLATTARTGSGDGGSVHDGIAPGGPTNTGAMAMPPPQHSPRTSAMLSGLPVGSEGPIMMGDPIGDLSYSATSPTSFMTIGNMGLMSPYQFPSAGIGGVGDGSDGSGSAVDPNQHFDFAAAIGGMGGGGPQGVLPNFPEFASLYSPNPVSPTFGAGRLSPLAGALSPHSLSPIINWAAGLQGFSN